MNHSEIIAGYIRYSNRLRSDVNDSEEPDDDPDETAYDMLHRLLRSGPCPEAWSLIVQLLKAVPDADLATVAAGPLEDVVRWRGTEIIKPLETEAAADPRFRWALRQIWLPTGEQPQDVLDRIDMARQDRD